MSDSDDTEVSPPSEWRHVWGNPRAWGCMLWIAAVLVYWLPRWLDRWF